MQYCQGSGLGCIVNVYNQILFKTGEPISYIKQEEKKPIKCLQRCDFQTDSMTLSSTNLVSKNAFPRLHYFCLTFLKIARICNSNNYRITYFEEKYPNLNCTYIKGINYERDVCYPSDWPNPRVLKNFGKLANYLYDYAQNNIVSLEIFIKDPFYTKIKRDEQMTVISFIGNAGGLLGLCMGLSMISLIEVLYYVVAFLLNMFHQ